MGGGRPFAPRELTDFTRRRREAQPYRTIEQDTRPLGERVHVGLVSGAIAIAAFCKEAVQIGREIIGAITEDVTNPEED